MGCALRPGAENGRQSDDKPIISQECHCTHPPHGAGSPGCGRFLWGEEYTMRSLLRMLQLDDDEMITMRVCFHYSDCYLRPSLRIEMVLARSAHLNERNAGEHYS